MGCFVPPRLCFDLLVSDCHCNINLLYWNMPARISLINGIEGFFLHCQHVSETNCTTGVKKFSFCIFFSIVNYPLYLGVHAFFSPFALSSEYTIINKILKFYYLQQHLLK